jgi:hypothetical protein
MQVLNHLQGKWESCNRIFYRIFFLSRICCLLRDQTFFINFWFPYIRSVIPKLLLIIFVFSHKVSLFNLKRSFTKHFWSKKIKTFRTSNLVKISVQRLVNFVKIIWLLCIIWDNI